MSVSHIIRHFEGAGKVPVDLRDVIGKVREMSLSVRVAVKAIDEPYDELKGTIYRYQTDADTLALVPLNHAVIAYSSRMPLGWQKLACCKELLHVLDPEPVRTYSREQVLDLADKMFRNFVPSPHSTNGLQTFADQLAKWQAVAALFPYGLYEDVYPKFVAGKITCDEVAEWVELPPEIVHVVLSDLWGHLRQTILAF